VYEEDRSRATRALGPRSRSYDRFPGHDPIAPTVFPKGRSAARPLGRQAPLRGVACDPQEEVTVSWSRTKRLPAWACPQMSSGKRWPSASNPQTPPVLAALATRLSGTLGEFQALAGPVSNLRCYASPGPAVTARSHISRPAHGWWHCNYETEVAGAASRASYAG
jgi:hypothetical protein